MKNNDVIKIAFVALVVMIGAYGFYTSNVLNELSLGQRMKLSLTLYEVESLANGENPPEPQGICYTRSRTKVEYQNCVHNGNSVPIIGREVIENICMGKDRGTCEQGSKYNFYNCYGECIASNDFTTTLVCH